MDHQQAIRTQASERYLLGEMKGALREEFEEHFMDCAECARDIRAGAMFVGNAKEVLRRTAAAELERTLAPASRRRESWIIALFRPAVAVPALAMLLGVIGYQQLATIAHLRSALERGSRPSAVPSFSLLAGSSRGQASVPVVVPREKAYTLYLDVPPQPAYPMYTLDVQKPDGRSEFSLQVSGEEAKKTVQILVPAGRLAAGDYVLRIRGAQTRGDSQGTEVGRVRFTLQYE